MPKKKSVPDCSKENGNNVSFSLEEGVTGNACYKYDFTLNNYTEEEVCQVKQTIRDVCKRAIFGFEVGEECGTPHLQGYISLKVKERITGITAKPGFYRASLRKVRNEEALIRYCRKDKDFWEYGFPKPIIVVEPHHPWQLNVMDIFHGEIQHRKIHWFWESKGGVGKSELVKYLVVKHGVLFLSGGSGRDIMNLVFNQNMDDCRAVVFDIPRAKKNKIDYAALESIKDGLICNTKYETGVKPFNRPHVFVFANFPPVIDTDDTLSKDKFDVWEIEI